MGFDDNYNAYSELRSKFKLNPENFSQHAELSQATLLLLNEHLHLLNGAKTHDPHEAIVLYSELKDLAESQAHDEIVVHRYFVAGGNLVSSFTVGRCPNKNLALRLYAELKQFLRRHSQQRASRSHLAAIAANLIKPIGRDDLSMAQAIYSDIEALKIDGADRDQIATWQANAAVSLIELTIETSFQLARKIYDELGLIAKDHNHIDAVVMDQCSAASMLFEHSRLASTTGSRQFYRDIRGWAISRPDLLQLKLQQLQCGAHVIRDSDDLEMGWDVFGELEAIAKSHLDREDVSIWYAAIMLFWAEYLRKHDLESAGRILAKLRDLGRALKDNSHIAGIVLRAEEIMSG